MCWNCGLNRVGVLALCCLSAFYGAGLPQQGWTQENQNGNRVEDETAACKTEASEADRQWIRREYQQVHLGVDVTITVYSQQEPVANEAAQAAFAEIARQERIFSDYDPESEAMRLCQTSPPARDVPISADLANVLAQSIELTHRTHGAFDISMGPVVKLWRRARRRQELPSPELVAQARQVVGAHLIELNATNRTVSLKPAGMQLDFGGIAKGYAAQAASCVLREQGCPHSLVAIAGDIVAGDAPPGTAGWKINVAPQTPDGPPTRRLLLANQSISTSGDAFQFVEIGGVRYSHIVNPQTGIGLTDRRAATVVAPKGQIADGLATCLCLIPLDQAAELLAAYPGSSALVLSPSTVALPNAGVLPSADVVPNAEEITPVFLGNFEQLPQVPETP